MGMPNVLPSPAMRMSAAVASSHPPPTQKPLIIAITGFGISSIASIEPSNAAA